MPEKPIGGTELMFNELMRRLDSSYLEKYSIFNYINQADFNKKTIYWNQLSYDQSAVQFLNDEQIKNNIDHYVFVSHWQAEKFRQIFQIPGYKTFVIKNAALDIPEKDFNKPLNKIKICYTSTPWRGLDILLDAWEKLNPVDCELHIFSSTKIYGEHFFSVSDFNYSHLWEKAESLSNVFYRGFTSNEDLRNELPDFDIMSYPCIFEETSCISVIEALSAGLKVVCSNIGALPETTEGWANMYTIKSTREIHIQHFMNELDKTIKTFREINSQSSLLSQVEIYKPRWSWETRINDWLDFFETIEKNNDYYFSYQSQPTTVNPQSYDLKELIREYDFENDDVIIDIGAKKGNFAEVCLERGSKSVFCYEPTPGLFEEIRLNTKISDHVLMSEKAVWSKTGLVISYLVNETNQEQSTAFTKNGNYRVETVSLDDVISEHEQIRLLKIDANGAEYPILMNCTQMHKIHEIIVKIHDINEDTSLELPLSYNKDCDTNQLIKQLSDFGFKIETFTLMPHISIVRCKKD